MRDDFKANYDLDDGLIAGGFGCGEGAWRGPFSDGESDLSEFLIGDNCSDGSGDATSGLTANHTHERLAVLLHA